jgi:tRNA (cytidine/uridine-2'-O-)-methyltransferase
MTIETVEPDFGLSSHDEGRCNLHIVLVHPEIPPNTGNIARLAAGTNAWLHLVKPLGFELKDKYVRRAGLDYWPAVRLSVHESLADLEPLLPNDRTWLFTKYAETLHTEPAYGGAPVLVFGSESRGLPSRFKERRADRLLRIPTTGDVRSLNLSNAVAVSSYEVLRQQGWRGETPMES